MKKYMLLSFFLSINLHSAYNEIHLLSLPQELIFYILNFASYKTGYKNIIISKAYYDALSEYLLYKQNILLSKNNISDAEKKQIVFNNRILLGHLRNSKKEIGPEEEIIKEWNHGFLKCLFNSKGEQLFYLAKENDKKLYIICITNPEYPPSNDTVFDFLEWNYPKNPTEYNQHVINFLKTLKTNRQIIKFPYLLPDKFILSTSFQSLLKYTTHVKLLFSHPTSLCLPGDFNKLDIIGNITEIYFDEKIDRLNGRQSKKKKSLSLKPFIDQGTKTLNFGDLERLIHLKKLALDFNGNRTQNHYVGICCPQNLEALILKNCPFNVLIPKKLKNLKIISPRKGCSFDIFDKIKSVENNIPNFTVQSNTMLNLETLTIENDQNNYVKNILRDLKISKSPKNTITKNCSYTELPTYHPQKDRLN